MCVTGIMYSMCVFVSQLFWRPPPPPSPPHYQTYRDKARCARGGKKCGLHTCVATSFIIPDSRRKLFSTAHTYLPPPPFENLLFPLYVNEFHMLRHEPLWSSSNFDCNFSLLNHLGCRLTVHSRVAWRELGWSVPVT